MGVEEAIYDDLSDLADRMRDWIKAALDGEVKAAQGEVLLDEYEEFVTR